MINNDTKESLKRHAYRHAWPRRHQLTPSAEKGRGKGLTWGQWLEKKNGVDIKLYHAELKQKIESGV